MFNADKEELTVTLPLSGEASIIVAHILRIINTDGDEMTDGECIDAIYDYCTELNTGGA